MFAFTHVERSMFRISRVIYNRARFTKPGKRIAFNTENRLFCAIVLPETRDFILIPSFVFVEIVFTLSYKVF